MPRSPAKSTGPDVGTTAHAVSRDGTTNAVRYAGTGLPVSFDIGRNIGITIAQDARSPTGMERIYPTIAIAIRSYLFPTMRTMNFANSVTPPDSFKYWLNVNAKTIKIPVLTKILPNELLNVPAIEPKSTLPIMAATIAPIKRQSDGFNFFDRIRTMITASEITNVQSKYISFIHFPPSCLYVFIC